jgi:hypothetical protein
MTVNHTSAPHRPEGPDSGVEAVIDEWVSHQLAAWAANRPNPSHVERQSTLLNQHLLFCIFEIRKDGSVAIQPKAVSNHDRSHPHVGLSDIRGQLYLRLLEEVVRTHNLSLSVNIPVGLGDHVPTRPGFPIFCFQKIEGSHNVLLPDVDFLGHNWYPPSEEELSFECKYNSAIFVGSSTGSPAVAATLREIVEYNLTPRLHLASLLHGHNKIHFRIARAVQVGTSEPQKLLEAKPYFSKEISFDDQLKHKFIISIDGNGATCSRVALALRSESVLLKFDSPYQLYYFDGLNHEGEYLAVRTVSDIERIIALEEQVPGRFQCVAQNGKTFYQRYLTREAGYLYVAKLLQRYASLLH